LLGGVLEQDDAFGAGGPYPVDLAAPVVDVRNQIRKRVPAQVFGDGDLDLVAFFLEAQIQRRQIA